MTLSLTLVTTVKVLLKETKCMALKFQNSLVRSCVWEESQIKKTNGHSPSNALHLKHRYINNIQVLEWFIKRHLEPFIKSNGQCKTTCPKGQEKSQERVLRQDVEAAQAGLVGGPQGTPESVPEVGIHRVPKTWCDLCILTAPRASVKDKDSIFIRAGGKASPPPSGLQLRAVT